MKFLLAIAIAVGIGAVAYAAAATLTVNGGTVQSGSNATASCQTGPLSIDYVLDGNNVQQVVVSGINGTACAGTDVIVSVTGGAGLNGTAADIAASTLTVTCPTAPGSVPIPGITGVTVTIADTAASSSTCTASP